jgi:hypothetical protein
VKLTGLRRLQKMSEFDDESIISSWFEMIITAIETTANSATWSIKCDVRRAEFEIQKFAILKEVRRLRVASSNTKLSKDEWIDKAAGYWKALNKEATYEDAKVIFTKFYEHYSRGGEIMEPHNAVSLEMGCYN